MQKLSSEAEHAVEELAERHMLSVDAVRTLLVAVQRGGNTMAQFTHRELGGHGQWMRGGMTMVGDFGNGALRAKVDAVCSALAELLASQTVFVDPPGADERSEPQVPLATTPWWPRELGVPTTAGGQNDTQYAYFPAIHRLAVRQAGAVEIYDTEDHAISGVSQQQGGSLGSVTFSSQHGTVSVDRLPRITRAKTPSPGSEGSVRPSPPEVVGTQEILGTIERLDALRRRGALSEEEFQEKKRELLSRL